MPAPGSGDVGRDLRAAPYPDVATLEDPANEALEHRQAPGSPDELRMQREDAEAAEGVQPVGLLLPELENLPGRPDRLRPVTVAEPEVRRVVEDPLHRQLHHPSGVPVGPDVVHEV